MRGVQGSDLCPRIWARLEAEPTVLAPQRRSAGEMLRRRPLRVAASIAAVAFVGWMALFGLKQDPPQIAAVPAPQGKEVAMPGLNSYLLAHEGYSPSGAIQGVAPYVRTVAEQRGADAR